MKKNLEVTSSMKGQVSVCHVFLSKVDVQFEDLLRFFYNEWIQEKRDGLLGQLFALGAIVAGKVPADDGGRENAELTLEITEHLLSLAKKKVFLREPAITVLLHLVEKVIQYFLNNFNG